MAGGNVPSSLGPIFAAASRAYHIPANVLAGIASVETNLGQNKSTSSAGAVGLMQFLPSTASGIGVNPYDDRSAIFGAAKLLNQYGYQQNPTRAIGAYNGGPGNPQYGYARQVLSEAQRLAPQVARYSGTSGPSSSIGAPPRTPQGLPGMPSSITQTTFNQQGYDRENKRYILGQFLKSSGKSPFDIGPKIPGLSDTNPLLSLGILPSAPPNTQDFTGTKVIQLAHNELQKLAGGASLNVHPGATPGYRGYVNPISGATVGRTDMGVDASGLANGHPIRAIGNSRVVGISPNWYSGQPYVALQFLDGPDKGKFYYVAEAIRPTVRPGQVVHAGDTIGTYNSGGTGLELGWGTSTPGRTLAQATTGYTEGQVTPAGADFRNLLNKLGAR